MESKGWLEVEEVGHFAVIRLNRPEKLNPLDPATLALLATQIRRYGQNSESSGIVLTGTGRAFSAGDDLSVEVEDAEAFAQVIASFQEVTSAILDSTVPIIAAINGLAVGGASEMCLVCDARVASRTAELMLPENRIGLTISNGASAMLKHFLGPRALSFVLDAPRLSAERAHELGLIDHLIDATEDVVAAALGMLERWTADGTSTQQHLVLLRPDRSIIDAAMGREARAARSAWEAGLVQKGLEAFGNRK